MKYDFGGWATKANLLCGDGRTILSGAFKEQSGQKVPLVWGHIHDDPSRVLGHAILEDRNGDMYAYCTFNDSENANIAKILVKHGDVNALSICANKLQQRGSIVQHGIIREVSLVLAGANPGATIDEVMCHSDSGESEYIIYTGMPLDIELEHGGEDERFIDILKRMDDDETEDETEDKTEDEDEKENEDTDEDDEEDEELKHSSAKRTMQEVIDSMDADQRDVLFALVAQAGEAAIDLKEENDMTMKHSIFDNPSQQKNDLALTHADCIEICKLAKDRTVGSLQTAIKMYVGEDTLQHAGFYDNTTGSTYSGDGVDVLFPEYKDILKNPPEFITDNDDWVAKVINGVHKSPISRIRTRQTDIRTRNNIQTYYDGQTGSGHTGVYPGNRGKGYIKGAQKSEGPVFPLLIRTTDPQTVYRRDSLHRDDIIDITDFDVVAYQYQVMKKGLEYEIARAILLGDGRLDNDPDKIFQDHIRSVYLDVSPYVIRKTVDFDTTGATLQGNDTDDYFGEGFIKAETLVQELLTAKISYRGSGNETMFCTQQFINTMLLARDRDGRRLYTGMSDVCASLGVKEIVPCEEMLYTSRTTADSKVLAPIAIVLNLGDYTLGSTKGGEITRFNQFDIDYNKEKYLIETRLSGALVRAYSAIVLEEDITPAPDPGTGGGGDNGGGVVGS